MEATGVESQMPNAASSSASAIPTMTSRACWPCSRRGVTAVADVRSRPYSRRLPQFNREPLEAGLRQAGIAYVFLGDTLGGRPAAGESVRRPTAGWTTSACADRFLSAWSGSVGRPAAGSTPSRCCAAKKIRSTVTAGLMITPALLERDIAPLHLRRGCVVETTAAMETRLLRETRVGTAELGGLFPLSDEDRRALLAEAYRAMSRKKAFQLDPEAED